MTVILVVLQLWIGLTWFFVAVAAAYRTPRIQSVLPLRAEGWVTRTLLALMAILAAFADIRAIGEPFLAFFAACFSVLVTLALLAFSSARDARFVSAAVATVLASIGMAFMQPLGLKVMFLPKADRLQYVPVEAHVVKTYDEGVWFESVRAGSDGTLYLAANIGLNFARGDYYGGAHGEVIERRKDGVERVLFTTPVGSAAGVFAVAADGTLYMSSNGVTPGIWRIGTDGSGALMTKLPRGAWPNGLDFGPDGMLYSPDSALGLIWRINPQTGEATRAFHDDLLRARRFISLAPGANGLHFIGRNMIVTNSDSTKVLQYTLHADGNFGGAVALASGIPGDDFAIGHDGSFFITTHPYNTLIRVYPDGRRVIIGDARQHIVGSTDAVFGRGLDDRDVLYVVTDGGAFTGGPKTRGQLIALKPYASGG